MEKNNVYVGLRYVPKIMGEWNETKDYEGLSIVTYQGTSYTSKKRVPVGVNILNEEFWVVTGNYNAQVEIYRDELRSYQNATNDTLETVTTNISQHNEKLIHVDEELIQVNEELIQVNDSINQNHEETRNRLKHYINVMDFGAVGDGVTNDTVAIQNAINSMTGKQRSTLLFPPTNGKYYLVDELTIPANTPVILLEGIGDSRIEFTGQTGFHIKSEFIVFRNLALINQQARITGNTIGTVLFKDERPYNRLDFDIKVEKCDISYFQTVCSTWGRGVNFDNCGFSNVSGNIIHLTVRPELEIEVGNEIIQKYKTGYRGYVVKNSRLHYCNGYIMRTSNDIEKVVQGVQIQDNQIEGGMGYYIGYVRNGLFTANNHYQANTTLTSLFAFAGFDNVIIDINIDGMQLENDGYTKRIERLLETHDYGKGLKISGNLTGLAKHAVTFYKGGSQIEINLNIDDVSPETSYTPSLLVLAGTGHYEAFNIGGSFNSKQANTLLINKTTTVTAKNIKHDQLLVLGEYSSISNIV